MNHLRQAIERADGNSFARFAVLFLDLDRFKVVNDSLGHSIGDKLLVGIAERLASCIRPGDIVGRLGGDEFTILLNRTGAIEDVARVAASAKDIAAFQAGQLRGFHHGQYRDHYERRSTPRSGGFFARCRCRDVPG
jgi:diguanylate cyclase (GGDEF)-like protein